jgi:hypothetical protein
MENIGETHQTSFSACNYIHPSTNTTMSKEVRTVFTIQSYVSISEFENTQSPSSKSQEISPVSENIIYTVFFSSLIKLWCYMYKVLNSKSYYYSFCSDFEKMQKIVQMNSTSNSHYQVTFIIPIASFISKFKGIITITLFPFILDKNST